MEFKGTKGKWSIMDASRFEVPFIIINDNDETIFQCYNAKQANEAQANALIISKSPEMLEMLENIFKDYDYAKNNWEKLEQLIKEATEI